MRYTFQVILRPDGEIIYQYLSMQNTLSSASIGIENQIGTSRIEVTFDAPYVHDNLAIRFTSTNIVDWLSVAPTSGSLPAQASVNVDVAVDATGLPVGTCNREIVVLSNDRDESRIVIPVTRVAGNAAAIDQQALAPPGLGLHGNQPNPFNPFTTIRYALPLEGRV